MFLDRDSSVLCKELDEKSQGDKHNVATVKRSAPKSTPGSFQHIPGKIIVRTQCPQNPQMPERQCQLWMTQCFLSGQGAWSLAI